jgi:hypothetical protein
MDDAAHSDHGTSWPGHPGTWSLRAPANCPTRTEAVKAGRRSAIEARSAVSRPRLDRLDHGGRLDYHQPEERTVVECGPLWFSPARIDAAARSTVLYAVQGRAAHGPQVFDAATSRTLSMRDRRRKNRAVVEARPSRDSIPPRDAAKDISIELGLGKLM